MTDKRRATYVPEPEANRTTTIIERVADRETRRVAVIALVVASAALGCAVVGMLDNIGQSRELAADQAAIDSLRRDVVHLAQVDEQAASQLAGIDPTSLTAALATPCATEDSVNCVWFELGNAFVNVEGHAFPLTSGQE